MPDQTPKEQYPAMIAEVVNRTSNVESIEVIQNYLARVQISGAEAYELGRAMGWLQGVHKGEKARIAELKAKLPQENTEIDLTEKKEPSETPHGDAPVVPPEDWTRVGAVEMTKGSEVLQPQ